MIEKLDVSPYLLAPPRSLRQACIDVTGCGGGSPPLCSKCGLLQLCMPEFSLPLRAVAAEHRVERLGIRVIPGGARREPAPVRLRGV